MKKSMLYTMLVAVLLLSGCSTMSDTLYEETTTIEQFDEPMVKTADGGIQKLDSYLAANGQAPPEEAIIQPGNPVQVTVRKPREQVQGALSVLKGLPIPFADVAGWVLSGALGIGSIFMHRRKKLAEKVAESTVKGIDTFRDILDQTAGGEQIDAYLKDALKGQQDKLQVTQEVAKLLDRYATPSKPRGGIQG